MIAPLARWRSTETPDVPVERDPQEILDRFLDTSVNDRIAHYLVCSVQGLDLHRIAAGVSR